MTILGAMAITFALVISFHHGHSLPRVLKRPHSFEIHPQFLSGLDSDLNQVVVDQAGLDSFLNQVAIEHAEGALDDNSTVGNILPRASKIVAYSLYGNNPRYMDGALANSKLINEFFPGWKMRVYYDQSVPEYVLEFLHAREVELVDMSNDTLSNKMVWRFLPSGEADLERFVSRDIDARLSEREAAAVREWEESDLPFHVLRDHPSHSYYAVSGGLWGSKGGAIKDIRARLESSALENDFMRDMDFLNSQIWPLMNETGVLVHDSFSCERPNTRPFPTTRVGVEHVGSVYIDDVVRQDDADVLLSAIAAGIPDCSADNKTRV